MSLKLTVGVPHGSLYKMCWTMHGSRLSIERLRNAIWKHQWRVTYAATETDDKNHRMPSSSTTCIDRVNRIFFFYLRRIAAVKWQNVFPSCNKCAPKCLASTHKRRIRANASKAERERERERDTRVGNKNGGDASSAKLNRAKTICTELDLLLLRFGQRHRLTSIPDK